MPSVKELITAGTVAPLVKMNERSPARPPKVAVVRVPNERRPASPLPTTTVEFCKASALSRISLPPVMRV